MRLFVFLGSLIVLLLMAALVVPPYVDWNRYKGQFEEHAARILGQKVEVRGATSLRLLPLPTVTFNDLVVGGDNGPKLTADSFRMDLELAPLLRGNIVIVDMALTKPDLSLTADAQGKVDWVARSPDLPVSLSGDDVQVENIAIIDGRLEIDDQARDRKTVLDTINLTASANTLVGPWQVNGRLSAVSSIGQAAEDAASDIRFSLNTGRWQSEQGQLGLRLTVEPKDLPYDFALNGPFVLRNGVPSITAQFTIRPAGAASADDRITFPRPAADTALPIRMEGTALLVAGGVTVPSYQLDVGSGDVPYTLTGAGRANFDDTITFRATAEGQQINLEQLNAVQAAGQTAPPNASPNEGAATGGTQKLSLKERIDLVRALAKKLPRFSADGLVSLYLPAVVAGDTVVREIGVDLRPTRKDDGGEAGWTLRNFEAQLPGRTELRADGDVYLGDAPSFAGDLIVASKQPSGFAAWIGADDNSVIRTLPSAGFSAKAVLDGDGLRFDDLEVALGDTSLKGDLVRTFTDEGRSSISASLAGETINLDQLAALYRLFRSTNGVPSDPSTAMDGLFGGEDVALSLAGQTVLLDGLTAKDVDFTGRVEPGAVRLDTLTIGSLEGATITAKGTMAGLKSDLKGAETGALEIGVSGSDVSQLLQLLETRIGPTPILSRLAGAPELIGDTELSLILKASSSGLSFEGEGVSGGTLITLRADDISLTKGLTTGGLQSANAVSVILENPNSAHLLRQLNVPSVVDLGDLELMDSGRGALRLKARKTDQATYQVEGALTLLEGYASFEGPLVPTRVGSDVALEGGLQVSAEINDLDVFTRRFGVALPGGGFSQAAQGETRLVFSPQSIEAQALDAKVAGTKVSGALALEIPKRPDGVAGGALDASVGARTAVPKISGTLNLDRLSANTVLALVHGDKPSALQGMASAAGQPALLDRFNAQVDLRVDRLALERGMTAASSVDGGSFVSQFASTVGLKDGDLRFDAITGAFADGSLAGDLSLGKTLTGRFVNGQFSASDMRADRLQALLAIPLNVQGKVSGAITFDSTVERATEGSAQPSLLGSVTGNGAVRISDGTINGLNAGALKPILRAADRLEDDALSGRGADLAASTIYAGSFEFAETEIPFSVSAGVVRASNVRLTDERASLVADMRLDLAGIPSTVDPSLTLDARLTFDPGLEAVTGASPEVTVRLDGPLSSTATKIDAALLDSYLGLRLSEKRERAFEAQRSAILERQRLLQIARLSELKAQARRLAREERERIERLAREQEEARRREEAERKRREIEQARIEAELVAARRRAEQEAAEEAGRRAQRQREIDELRRSAEEAARRLERFRETENSLEAPVDP
ncbi:MAG: AsmA family protein [Pseudomonadota bacterium]